MMNSDLNIKNNINQEKKINLLTGSVLILIILSFIFFLFNNINWKNDKNTKLIPDDIILQNCDIVFQQTTGDFSEHIKDIIQSPMTHCGLILIKDNKKYVLEAEQSVKLTPFDEWIKNGIDNKIAVKRMLNLDSDSEKKIINEGEKFIGRLYDYKFEWSDDKLYCSELVYKAFERGADIKLGKMRMLIELNYIGHEDFIMKITEGKPPLNEKIITTKEMFNSKNLKTIYSNF